MASVIDAHCDADRYTVSINVLGFRDSFPKRVDHIWFLHKPNTAHVAIVHVLNNSIIYLNDHFILWPA